MTTIILSLIALAIYIPYVYFWIKYFYKEEKKNGRPGK